MRPSPTPPTPRLSAWIVFVMLAMIAIPAAIALHTVHIPGMFQISAPNPSPHGYTWSLLLFVVPILTIGLWFKAWTSRSGPSGVRSPFWFPSVVLWTFSLPTVSSFSPTGAPPWGSGPQL